MKTLLILSIVLCSAALLVRAATVAPAETAAVQQEDKPAPNLDVVADAAFLPKARFQFCLDGWLSFRGTCYLLVNQHDTWRNAESFCAEFDASLASVHNTWEYNFLQRMVKTGDHTFAWIGGYFFQGDWRWEDGTQVNYHKWESMSSTEDFQCLQLNSQESRGWSNQACNERLPFVCQSNPNC